MEKDAVAVRTVGEAGEPAQVFRRMRLALHTPDGGLPETAVLEDGYLQMLPGSGCEGTLRPALDRGFSVLLRMNGERAGMGLTGALQGICAAACCPT